MDDGGELCIRAKALAEAEAIQRHQPKDYRVLRSHLGNKAELEEAIAALHRHGVRIYEAGAGSDQGNML